MEELFIPKLGQTVEEVTLVAWSVPDGAKVTFGQPVLEVETDKAVFPVEANADGYIHLGPHKMGDRLPVLAVVATIGRKDEAFQPAASSQPGGSEERTDPAYSADDSPEVRKGSGQFPDDRERPFASPRARKLAREKGVDLLQITPSGGGGTRIAERDVTAYLRAQPKVTPLAKKIAQAQGIDLKQIGAAGKRITKEDVARALRTPVDTPGTPRTEPAFVKRTPLKGVRALIAERMAASVHTGARVTLFSEVDATQLVALRRGLKDRFESQWGLTPSYNDLLVKICAAALTEHPYMNARLAGEVIEELAEVNIGVAVDTERGLLVPVIHHADRLSLREVAETARGLVERARAGRSLPDELTGGTFTITNLGMYGVDGFTPVINLPECAILGVGRITSQPVYVGESLVRQERVILSLAFDHRIVDGAPAARFLQTVSKLVESPALAFVD